MTTVYTRPQGRSNYFDQCVQAAFVVACGGYVEVVGKNEKEVDQLIRKSKDIVSEWGFKCEDEQFVRVVVE